VTDPHVPTQAPNVPWHLRPLWVLVLLFFVLGPLGLPHLWKSPCFSQGMKIVLTIAVLAYTALLLSEVIAVVRTIQDQLLNAEF